MVSNKVPATADCLSDGIHKAKERTKEEDGGGRRRTEEAEGRGEREAGAQLTGKHQKEMEGWRKPAPSLVMGAFVKGRQERVTVVDGAEWKRNGGKKLYRSI